MRHLGLLSLAASSLAIGACTHPSAPAAESGGAPATVDAADPMLGHDGYAPRVVTDAEIQPLVAALLQRLDDATRRVCKRPVLRGAATAGAAADDQRGFDDPTGPLASCMTALRAAAEPAKLKDAVAARAPEVVAVERDCGAAVAAAIATAVAHEDACAAYRVGIRPDPEAIRTLSVAYLMTLHATVLGAREPARALEQLLDTVRFSHDLARGGSLVALMIAAATTEIALEPALDGIDWRALNEPALAGLAAQVDTLLATMPPFADGLRAERDFKDLYFGVAQLQPPDWVVPGGWPAGVADHRAAPTAHVEPGTPDPRDEPALTLLVDQRVDAVIGPACPDGATLKDCVAGLATAASASDDAMDLNAAMDDLRRTLLVQAGAARAGGDQRALFERLRRQTRDTIVELMARIGGPPLDSYAAKLGAAVARLGELRLAIEIRRSALRAHRCPTLAELERPPFVALRTPPGLGDALVITQAADHAFEIAPPAWVTSRRSPWRVVCR